MNGAIALIIKVICLFKIFKIFVLNFFFQFLLLGRPCANEFSKRKRLIGAYIPQCDQNGFYKSLQCHSSIGKCWCVDKYGVEFLNTRQRGKVNCEKLDGKMINKVYFNTIFCPFDHF